MNFEQLQRFNIFPNYVEDTRRSSKVAHTTPFILTYTFIAAMIILIITEIALLFHTTEVRTEVQSVAYSDKSFFLDLTCDDVTGCILDLMKKDKFAKECYQGLPITLQYQESKTVRLCRVAGRSFHG